MKNQLIIFIFLLSFSTFQSQNVQHPDVENNLKEDFIPFNLIEEPPVYPGCEKLNMKEQKKCFSEKVAQLVSSEFNLKLASILGIPVGKQRINVMFTIDENGNVVDISARAPHIQLENEAIRIIKKLPQMIPGKQRDRAVKVKYSLPISFIVEENNEKLSVEKNDQKIILNMKTKIILVIVFLGLIVLLYKIKTENLV